LVIYLPSLTIIFLHSLLLELAKDYFSISSTYELIGGYLSPVNDQYIKEGLINSIHRVKMCELALESSSWIMTDSWESQQTHWQSTRSVLEHAQSEIKKVYPKISVRVMLLTGSDLVKTFQIPGLWTDTDVRKTLLLHR
jgi:nicotinamide mononucleotide adenylyltransferase